MNVPAVFAAEDPALPDPDLDDEEWEDVEVEEMDPAIANQELGEEVIQYEPDEGEMSADTEPILYEICLIVGTLVIALCSAIAIYKEVYPTFFSFSLMAIVGGEISSLWVPMTWAGPLLALSFVSAAKLYDAEDMADQLADEDDEDSRYPMDRRRG
ncbi:hypothetical protein HPB49_006454 [Dermacentor silvarum]|uniref:Uncharacterized protein n=1 Tax=Dermacentor silvarum TaxID=543639 RepID=A0ACB8CQ42_DERSI|nr:uncharacterized protein LOC125945761 [Dermacentor silvarum]KAH7949219.1 hypothetical protein HPB49_006454 [Dermacentor silvarum]